MDNKIVEKYNYPKILEVKTADEIFEFRNHFNTDTEKSIAFSYWKGNKNREIWTSLCSIIKSREDNNDVKREFTRFIYTNCETLDSDIFTDEDEIKCLLEKEGVTINPKYPNMMKDHWISPQSLGEFYLDETLDSTLDGKRHLDDISKYFEYTEESYNCISVPKQLNDKLSSHSPISNNKMIEKYITEKKYDILDIPLYQSYGIELSQNFRDDFFKVPEGMTDWEISKYGARRTRGSNLTVFMN